VVLFWELGLTVSPPRDLIGAFEILVLGRGTPGRIFVAPARIAPARTAPANAPKKNSLASGAEVEDSKESMLYYIKRK